MYKMVHKMSAYLQVFNLIFLVFEHGFHVLDLVRQILLLVTHTLHVQAHRQQMVQIT